MFSNSIFDKSSQIFIKGCNRQRKRMVKAVLRIPEKQHHIRKPPYLFDG